jgi:O-methyltransferase involved in polyketide biosynthesis
MRTLATLAAAAPGTVVVFSILAQPPRDALGATAARAAARGEPWRTTFDPAALCTALRGPGFRSVDVLDPAAANARYFAGRSDGLHVGGGGRLITARV